MLRLADGVVPDRNCSKSTTVPREVSEVGLESEYLRPTPRQFCWQCFLSCARYLSGMIPHRPIKN
eukprot:9501291-Pyramimonas_sp.AAC.1